MTSYVYKNPTSTSNHFQELPASGPRFTPPTSTGSSTAQPLGRWWDYLRSRHEKYDFARFYWLPDKSATYRHLNRSDCIILHSSIVPTRLPALYKPIQTQSHSLLSVLASLQPPSRPTSSICGRFNCYVIAQCSPCFSDQNAPRNVPIGQLLVQISKLQPKLCNFVGTLRLSNFSARNQVYQAFLIVATVPLSLSDHLRPFSAPFSIFDKFQQDFYQEVAIFIKIDHYTVPYCS